MSDLRWPASSDCHLKLHFRILLLFTTSSFPFPVCFIVEKDLLFILFLSPFPTTALSLLFPCVIRSRPVQPVALHSTSQSISARSVSQPFGSRSAALVRLDAVAPTREPPSDLLLRCSVRCHNRAESRKTGKEWWCGTATNTRLATYFVLL